ncbi:MAG: hypothetical protein H0W44_00115 [Gammaproteobacteria bacterium]|nr:hypothetical protein [Gammaproteobacteria bacterium]
MLMPTLYKYLRAWSRCRVALGAVLLLLAYQSPVIAQDLRTIGQLARDGAPELALKLLDNVQPSAQTNLEGWLFFEQQRINIMRENAQWDLLTQRLQQLPSIVPVAFRHEALLELANAALQQGKGVAAREVLQQLIWHSDPAPTADNLALFRRLIIRSYIIDDRLEDAERSMLRYQQDYGDKGLAWGKLRARVLLLTAREAEARDLLQQLTESDAETIALKLLAQLKTQSRELKNISQEALAQLKIKNLEDMDRSRLWYIVALTAKESKDYPAQIRALENVVIKNAYVPKDDRLFKIKNDVLWDSYLQYGLAQGNSLQLLIGQDKDWVIEANKWFRDQPTQARALFTVVMLKGLAGEQRDEAFARFVESLETQTDGMLVVRQLFLYSDMFADVQRLPAALRYRLVDDALARNDLAAANRLMADLTQAPKNSDALEWALRRARVFILSGRAKEGITALNAGLDAQKTLDKNQLDKVLQVIFDLQTVRRDEDALLMFTELLRRPLADGTRREILFWMADSYKAQKNAPLAAAYYLNSATLLDGRGDDPWGQTARFQAADVLLEAGLFDDARRIYQQLLSVTQAADRRAMIKYKLQEIGLRSQATQP